jgi:hypothetical protein
MVREGDRHRRAVIAGADASAGRPLPAASAAARSQPPVKCLALATVCR